MSRRHHIVVRDELAECERGSRYWGPYTWYGFIGRSAYEPLSHRQARAVFRLVVGLFLVGVVLLAVIQVRGGKPPIMLQAVTATSLIAVIVLASLDFFAKRALHEIHCRRWPGD